MRQSTRGVEHKGTAIKHQFILPTDEVGINDRAGNRSDALAQNIVASVLLVHVER